MSHFYFYDRHTGMGLCFIGKRKFSPFISQYLPDQIGLVKSIETHDIIGEHRGLHHYTMGQRISPINQHQRFRPSKPLFIAKKDQIENIIYTVTISIFPQFTLLFFLSSAGTRNQSSSPIHEVFHDWNPALD
jgi:tRNA U34 2-thiouridine synthase MnmA/TrmU